MNTRVVHCKKDIFDVYIGRPSKWGNPFTHKSGTIAQFRVSSVKEAVTRYEEWVKQQSELMASLWELRGKVLGCWCKPGPCHGDILARLADEIEMCTACRIRVATTTSLSGWLCARCDRNLFYEEYNDG